MIARPRKATMPRWRSAARTTARGVPLRFSILRRLRLAHQADLGDTGLLKDREDRVDLAIADAVVTRDQHLEFGIRIVERGDLGFELVHAHRLALGAVSREVDLTSLVDGDDDRVFLVLQGLGIGLRQLDVDA